MKTGASGSQEVKYRLVIGCHEGLERYIQSDTKNGKKLIAELVTNVAAETVIAESTIPNDIRTYLGNETNHFILVFVGHGDSQGQLLLTDKTIVNPDLFLQNFSGWHGKLTLFLYTCHGHLWTEAVRRFLNGPSRDFSTRVSINVRVCTTSEKDVRDQKLLANHLQNFYPIIGSEVSEAGHEVGHKHLNFDAHDDELSLPINLP